MVVENNLWVRYRWNLNNLPDNFTPPEGFTFNYATRSERDEVIVVVLSAYGSDAVWKNQLGKIARRMIERIKQTMGKPCSIYLVARRYGRIVAVSGIAKKHWTDQNLLTGICVSPEFQRRGLGKFLLGLSLLELKKMGLQSAQVYTESGSPADDKIYPLFGSEREANVSYPGAEVN